MTERCNCDASCGENRYHDKGSSGCRYEADPVPPNPVPAAPRTFDLASFKPPHGQMDGSGKFSPNLYRWLKKWTNRYAGMGMPYWPTVFRHSDGSLWIGRVDSGKCFIGARLMRVLCNGARQEIYAIMPRDAAKLKPLANFWRDYKRNGRCAIDRDHTMYWQEDDSRWEIKGKKRSCQWCGKFHQRLQVRTEIKRTVVKKWVNA